MTDHPAWLSQGAPQGETQPLVLFHYPLAFTLVGREAGPPPTVTVETPLADMSAADLAYMEKVLNFVTAQQQRGKVPLPRLDSQPSPAGTMPTGRMCDLCEMAHYTQWYAEFYSPFRFTILDCDSCEVPIAVLGEHRVDVRPEEVAFMENALNLVAEHKYSEKFPKWMFDHNMRQIPDHYHFHVRPLLW